MRYKGCSVEREQEADFFDGTEVFGRYGHCLVKDKMTRRTRRELDSKAKRKGLEIVREMRRSATEVSTCPTDVRTMAVLGNSGRKKGHCHGMSRFVRHNAR